MSQQTLLRKLKNQLSGQRNGEISGPTNVQKMQRPINLPKPVFTHYESKSVDIPKNFLSNSSPSSRPEITLEVIDFSKTDLPEYSGAFAIILENTLSAEECDQLLKLAAKSTESGEWKAAMVNGGIGVEYYAPEVRDCERIIWDEKEMVKRIWDRCLLQPGLQDLLGTIENNVSMQGERAVKRGEKWKFTRLNERMRFLRYGPGQYFKSHCDGSYSTPSGDERSFYTFHLYLNDAAPGAGGATTFHSLNMKRRLDVDPKMGRVLIFQHRGLLHSGDEVKEGIKYTMRTDLMYERIPE